MPGNRDEGAGTQQLPSVRRLDEDGERIRGLNYRVRDLVPVTTPQADGDSPLDEGAEERKAADRGARISAPGAGQSACRGALWNAFQFAQPAIQLTHSAPVVQFGGHRIVNICQHRVLNGLLGLLLSLPNQISKIAHQILQVHACGPPN